MATDPIEHVVLLMLENRSFDHILGGTPKVRGTGYAMDGINSYGGRKYRQSPGAARQIQQDPNHETPDVLVQLGGKSGVPPNGGFVLDYARSYHDLQDPSEVMKYHDSGALAAIHTLAGTFTVCDNWYASVPGPTWANRLFALSGTSLGRVSMPNGIMNLNLHWYDQATVFDRLNERNLSWKVYYGDTPLSFLFVHQWEPENVLRHHHMTEFFRDAAGDARNFPSFAFIEPAYMQPGANDAHPPHDIVESDVLVASVYNAIRANDSLWNSTLLVLLFDEHGGFYDHRSPAAAVPPDHHTEEYSFDRYGVRVPAVLISPFVGNGICSELMDHTSLLRYLQDKWSLGDLGARTAAANTFQSALQLNSAPRTDAPPRVQPTMTSINGARVVVDTLSGHQGALVAMAHNLEAMTDEDPNVIAARNRQMLTGPQSQIDVTVDRVDRFVAQQRREAADGNGR